MDRGILRPASRPFRNCERERVDALVGGEGRAAVRESLQLLAPVCRHGLLARLRPFQLTVSVSNRLTELQRQRALVQQHLAWIEREIATEAAQSGAPVHLSPPTPPEASPPAAGVFHERPVALAAFGGASDADAIIAQYRNESSSVKEEVRRGCFLYFALAFLLAGIAVIALYLYTRSRH
jgi:hypothetical protein